MLSRLRYKLEKNHKTLGLIASVTAIVMFITSIEVLISNYNKESKIIIQPLAMAFNGFIWVLYAFARKDFYLFIPNILAFVLGVLTVLVVYL